MLLNMTGKEFAKSLSEKIISLLFPGLNKTFHLLAQTEIFCKSLFKISVVIVGSGPDANKQVSSANNKVSDSKSSTISLM